MTTPDAREIAIAERFWAKVERRSDDECWPWTCHKNNKGYGLLSVATRKIIATHIALALAGKPRPGRLWALHNCDNPACVNPAHLRWGTRAENTNDAKIRNRFKRWDGERIGADNPRAKLDDAAVREIRRIRSEQGLTQIEIACLFGVGPTTISNILAGRSWTHVN